MEITTRENIIECFKQNKIKYRLIVAHKEEFFKRQINFKINNMKYIIIYYANESTLYINDKNGALVKFKYIGIDTNYPTKEWYLEFGYNKEKGWMGEDKITYDSFRIPLINVENNKRKTK